jgi:hypothetical protein
MKTSFAQLARAGLAAAGADRDRDLWIAGFVLAVILLRH